ncbi:mucin-5AC-like [Diaphorina citri]|uniref:Mucin-5AC-like n=1 Tax=Diaphorina citri TaxID=121845 RepID=A0A3Q0J8K1_DIACI|nr:mucin-5AC-like [Diaphorina citri]
MSSNYPEHLNPFATDYDEKFHLKQRLMLSFPSPPPRVRRSNSLRSSPQTPLASPACNRRTVSKFGKTRPAPSPPVKRAPNPPATALTALKVTTEPTQNRTQSPSEITSTQTSSKDATQTSLTSLKNINQTSSKITQSSTDETTPPSQNGTTRSSLKITSTQPSLKDATRTSPKISQLSANESIPPSQNGTIQSSSKITSQPCLKDETSSKITQLSTDETIPPFQNGTAQPSQNGTTQSPQRDTTPSVSPYTAHHSQFKTSQPSTKATPTFVSSDAMESGEISGPFPNSSFSSSQSSPNISASSSVSLASCIATPSPLLNLRPTYQPPLLSAWHLASQPLLLQPLLPFLLTAGHYRRRCPLIVLQCLTCQRRLWEIPSTAET